MPENYKHWDVVIDSIKIIGGIAFLAVLIILAVLSIYSLSNVMRTEALGDTIRACDEARTTGTQEASKECNRLMDITNTEYICSTSNSCWLEVRL